LPWHLDRMETGAIINLNLKLSCLAWIALVTLSISFSAALCAGQSAPQTQTSDPAKSSPGPATNAPAQDKPADQPSAQNPQGQTKPAPDDAKKNEDAKKNDRMFYVMPNYLTVDGQGNVPPVTWKEKFSMAAKGSFDPYEFTLVGIVAGIHQAANNDPAFGQGFKGYAKRYGAAFADQVDGNIMVGGVFPTILKIDPRYYRLGRGSFAHRFAYAIDRLVIARRDSGSHMFNVPEFAGNAVAIGISNVYYPAADRNFSGNFNDWGTQMGLDALGNELKEFWPDIHAAMQKSHGASCRNNCRNPSRRHRSNSPRRHSRLPFSVVSVHPNADSNNPIVVAKGVVLGVRQIWAERALIARPNKDVGGI